MEEKRDIVKSLGFFLAGLGVLLIGIGFITRSICPAGRSCFIGESNIPCEVVRKKCLLPFTSVVHIPPGPNQPDHDIDKTIECLKEQWLATLKELEEVTDNEDLKKAFSDPNFKKKLNEFFDSESYKKQLRKSLEDAEFEVVEKKIIIK